MIRHICPIALLLVMLAEGRSQEWSTAGADVTAITASSLSTMPRRVGVAPTLVVELDGFDLPGGMDSLRCPATLPSPASISITPALSPSAVPSEFPLVGALGGLVPEANRETSGLSRFAADGYVVELASLNRTLDPILVKKGNWWKSRIGTSDGKFEERLVAIEMLFTDSNLNFGTFFGVGCLFAGAAVLAIRRSTTASAKRAKSPSVAMAGARP